MSKKGKKILWFISFLWICLGILILFILYNRKSRRIESMESNSSTVIPLNIFQTWETKELPPKMRECVDKLKQNNPEFTHYLYDDSDRRDFIVKNFEPDVVEAYDTLVPGAFKADLWRYCILYKKGGVYLDIKFQTEPDFKLIELTDKEYFVLDAANVSGTPFEEQKKIINDPNFYQILLDDPLNGWKDKRIGIYNALMVCKPNNSILMECIDKIVENVKNRDYCYNCLYITGPGLLGETYFKGDYEKVKDIELFNSLDMKSYIYSKKLDKIIIKPYPEYRDEQKKFSPKKYYSELWSERKVFGE